MKGIESAVAEWLSDLHSVTSRFTSWFWLIDRSVTDRPVDIYTGFPRLLTSPRYFSVKFEGPGKSWKITYGPWKSLKLHWVVLQRYMNI